MTEEISKFIGKEDYSIKDLPMFKELINNITNGELGVLQSKIDENYYMARKSQVGFYIMTQSVNHAFKLTSKEAEQFPQFKWIPSSEMENIK